jgi:hypothetical protein
MTLGGSIFVRNGVKFDYCFKESILSLLEFCDKVSCVVVEGEDETEEIVRQLESQNNKLIVTYLPQKEWDDQQGKAQSKLCYFTDIAISKLETDYNFYQQADEIVHESCYDEIRKVIESNEPAYFCTRINLWESPYLQLNVPQNRKPCSSEIIRLAKTEFRSYGDAESLAVPTADYSCVKDIRMYHMGFVRKREVMKAKVINMQEGVFEMGSHDVKLDQSEIFNPRLWFGPEDLMPIDEPLPALIKEWAKERIYK